MAGAPALEQERTGTAVPWVRQFGQEAVGVLVQCMSDFSAGVVGSAEFGARHLARVGW